MPHFIRRDPLGKKAWEVCYSDGDPTRIQFETPIDFESDLPPNYLSGSKAVQIKLTKLLA
jgi:hypothetical protein